MCVFPICEAHLSVAKFHGDRQRDNDEVSPKHIADIALS